MDHCNMNEIRIKYKSIDGTSLIGILNIPIQLEGFALLMHGINETKNEWADFYKDMAEYLNKNCIGTLRFDFRGHGESGGISSDVSIIGDILDIKSSLKIMKKHWDGKFVFIATSFGAGPAIILASQIQDILQCIILIAPVLSYKETFLEPRTEWAKQSFNKESLDKVDSQGYLLLDGSFKLSANLIEEFKVIEPVKFLNKLEIPILFIHGNKDSMVPFEVTQRYSHVNAKTKLFTLLNADHGFPRR